MKIKNFIKKYKIILFITISYFYLFEIFLYFNQHLLFNEDNTRLNKLSNNLYSKDFDFRTSYEVLNDYRKKIDAVVTITPQNFLKKKIIFSLYLVFQIN